jgi:DNA-directed RNA polymerase I subunit RPA2
MYPKELTHHHEESEEMGGYFIINGIEKIIRLLLVQRRNYVMALVRSSFLKRGPMFTPYGVTVRCAREDESTQSFGINYLKDGDCIFRFAWRKQEYTIPLVLVLKVLPLTIILNEE